MNDPDLFAPLDPVARARTDHRQALRGPGDAHTCPVCAVRQTVRRRPLSRQMAAFLVALVRHERERDNASAYYTAREFLPAGHKASSDGSYLTAWGFIQSSEARGGWRSTAPGRRFADGKLRAAPAVWIVEPQGRVLGLDTEADPVNLAQCWGTDWDEPAASRNTEHRL